MRTNYIVGFARSCMQAGMLYTTSKRHEGYIAITTPDTKYPFESVATFVRKTISSLAGSDIYGLQNIFQKVERIWKPGCWKQKRKYVVVQLLSTTEKVRIEIASFTYCNYMLIYLYKHFSFRNIFIRWKAKQMSKRKGFSKLNLLNRFLFNETMEDPENPKDVTETLKDITGGGSHFLSLICFVIGGMAILLGLVRVWSVITLLWKSSRCEDL